MTMAASSRAVFFVFAILPTPRYHTQRDTVQPLGVMLAPGTAVHRWFGIESAFGSSSLKIGGEIRVLASLAIAISPRRSRIGIGGVLFLTAEDLKGELVRRLPDFN
jgi:hypothetical protein